MTWTVESVLALLRTVLPHAPEQFVLEHDGLRLVIGGEDASAAPAQDAVRVTGPVGVTVADGTADRASAGEVTAAPAGGASGEDALPAGAVTVVSPTVGTFYPRPEPAAPPYVSVGDRVEAGRTLGLVEVMKVFNAVAAPCDGVVHAILAGDGAFVEHGQPLLVLVPEVVGA